MLESLKKFFFAEDKPAPSASQSYRPKIQFSILTDPSPYLDETIASLQRTGFFNRADNLPIRLVAGSPESHLSKYKNDSRFVVDEMSQEEAREIHWHPSNGGLRCHKGHRRAMHPMRFRPGTTHLCIFECDLNFSEGWRERLDLVIREASSIYSDRFILSLYTPGDSSSVVEKSGKRLFVRGPGFYGAQAILFPIAMCSAYIHETSSRPIDQEGPPGSFMDRTYSIPYDFQLEKVFMGRFKVPILATAPCLVQHIGAVSRIESPPHTSLSWRKKL